MVTASCSAVGTILLAPVQIGATEKTVREDVSAPAPQRLDSGWQFRQGTIGGIDEVWRSEKDPLWSPAELPHCFNGQDACDPDKAYFRGQGWYRIQLPLNNPFPDGRTILHFQGAGQTTTLWVGSLLIGTHKGGYDEFAFDITDAVQQLHPTAKSDSIPVAVLCDNSSDRDRVPSDLSDFCLYGGLYRHVNLLHLPAVSIERVHVLPTLTNEGHAQVSVKARLYNPSTQFSLCTI
jgi:beta-galactosidase